MELHLTLSEACDLVKKDDPSLVQNADTLLGAALVLMPLAVLGPNSPSLLPVLGILGVKNELTKIGRRLFKKVTSREGDDALSQQKRMEAAYVIVCFSAFFQEADKVLRKAKSVMKIAKSSPLGFPSTFLKQVQGRIQRKPAGDGDIERAFDHVRVPFPHPIDRFDQQIEQLSHVYEQLSTGLLNLVKETSAWAKMDSVAQNQIVTVAQRLPKAACKRFRLKYFTLAARYHEFFIWSSLNEHMRTSSRIERLIGAYYGLAKLTESAKAQLDVGFRQLSHAIESLPAVLETEQSNRTISRLKTYYSNQAETPIVEELQSENSRGECTLRYPRNREAFIPQGFRVVRYSGKERLEEETTWGNAGAPRDDLGTFIFSYLSSPYGDDKPLVVLGHPGSGKSLLTKMLCVALFSHRWSPIRVVLRDVPADHDVVDQIEDQIRRDTLDSGATWASLQTCFRNCPPVIMLDGYDELLQATGKTCANYLIRVGQFQRQSRLFLKTPVRVIVTSRLTLMDKADIEPGTTVIRLEPFDDARIRKWIGIWNELNVTYFESHHLDKFALPQGEAENEQRIRALGEQPLLLLMIALYDSVANGIRHVKDIDRTVLYDTLLGAFIFRERLKKRESQEIGRAEVSQEVDTDMQRLGVAAMGMFARRSLYILRSQLESDLEVFGLRERSDALLTGRPLSPAEKLLGSFFFIVMSKASYGIGSHANRETDVAFEFMHNTFGEFLTADFILRRILVETESICALRKNENLRALLNRGFQNLDALPDDWYACLMHTPIHTRPVIVSMMKEWLKHRLQRHEREYSDFIEDFTTLVIRQVGQILTASGAGLSTILTRKKPPMFPPLPAMTQLAIYSLNLLVLRTALSDAPFVFDEKSIGALQKGIRPWDQLTCLWRSCFSLDDLNKLSAHFCAERNGTRIELRAESALRTPLCDTGLGAHLNVALALADNASISLLGLVINSVTRSCGISWEDLEKRLQSEDVDLGDAVTWYKRAVPDWFVASPPLGIELLRLALRLHRSAGPDIVEGLLSKHLSSSSSDTWSPGVAIRAIDLLVLAGDVEHAKDAYAALSSHPHCLDWAEASDSNALQLISLARRFGGLDLLERVHDRFSRLGTSLNGVDTGWELAVKLFYLACVFAKKEEFDAILAALSHNEVTASYFEEEPALIGELLRLQDKYGDLATAHKLATILHYCDVGKLPIGSLSDLTRLASAARDDELLANLGILGTHPSLGYGGGAGPLRGTRAAGGNRGTATDSGQDVL